MKNYYSHKKISPSITRIDSPNESAYLVEGTRRAALLDACSGAGDIGSYARSLTDLPLFLILTHGHVDHLGGSMTVAERYLSPRDWELAKEHGSYPVRRAHLLSRPQDGVAEEDIQPAQTEGFLPLQDLQEFDLGGICLKAIPLPGHTLGSMAILHREERTLLLGDACNTLTFLFFPGMPSIEEYRDTLTQFWNSWQDQFDTLLFSHFEQAGKELIPGNIRVCTDILEGRADAQPLVIPLTAQNAQPPLIAKRLTGHPRNRVRQDGGLGNIVYAPQNIRREGR